MVDNQHLQFTAKIWKNVTNLPPSEKKDRVQIMKNYEFPFLDIKMSWSPEGGLQFGVFRGNGQQLKYVGMGITHTPGTLRAIPSRVLNRLAQLTSRKPYIHPERVYNVYPNHPNALHKAVLAPPSLPTMGELWKVQYEKTVIEN